MGIVEEWERARQVIRELNAAGITPTRVDVDYVRELGELANEILDDATWTRKPAPVSNPVHIPQQRRPVPRFRLVGRSASARTGKPVRSAVGRNGVLPWEEESSLRAFRVSPGKLPVRLRQT